MFSSGGLDDSDEWMNIPPIVRQTLLKLEEDGHLSRKLTEALRSEHKQVNDLVRHLIDKQAGFEIDAARQQLLHRGGEPSRDTVSSIEELRATVEKHRRKIKDVQSVVEGDHKVQEKLNEVVGQFVERQDADLVRSREIVEHLRSELGAVSTSMEARLTEVVSDRLALRDELAQLSSQVTKMQQQLDGAREYSKALADRVKDALDFSKEVHTTVKTVQEDSRRSDAQNEQRFDSILRLVDKSRSVSEGQVESVKHDLLTFRLHVTSELEGQVKSMSAASAEIHAHMRTVENNCADSVLQLGDRCETLEANSRDDATTVQRLGTTCQQLYAQLGEVETHGNSLSRRVEQLFTSHDEHTAALSYDRAKVETFQLNLNRVDADVTHMRDDIRMLQRGTTSFASAADVSTIVRELAAFRQEQAEMRAGFVQLGDLVQRLSHTVEQVEKASAPALTPQSRACQTPDASPARDTPDLLAKERDARETGFAGVARQMTELERTTEQMTHQMESMDRRCTELSAVCRLTASLHDEYGSALREVRPALVEVETVKRRIAALEADKANSVYEQAAKGSTQRYVESLTPDLSKSVDDLKRREVDMLQTVQRLEHRMDALALHSIQTPRQEAATTPTEDAHGVVAQLSADITRTLETALAAETTAATFRATVEKRLRDYEASQSSAARTVDELRQETGAVRTELEAVRSELATARQAASRAQGLAASKASVQAVEKQVSEHSTRFEALESAMTRDCAEWAKQRLDATTREDAPVDQAARAAADALATRLEAAEAQLRALEASCGDRVDAATAHVNTTLQATEERVAQLAKAIADAEVKTQRTAGVTTRRMSEVTAQLLTAQSAQALCTTRLDRVEAQLADVSAPAPSLPTPEPVPAEESVRQETVDALEQRMETLVADLDARMGEVEAAQKASRDTAPSTGSTETEEEKAAAEVSSSYPREELEERFENMWTSIVSLLARKEDQEGVNKKLDGLHRLVGDELQVHLRRLQRDLDNVLSEKVSLAELQEILESSVQA